MCSVCLPPSECFWSKILNHQHQDGIKNRWYLARRILSVNFAQNTLLGVVGVRTIIIGPVKFYRMLLAI